jgi:RNA polymerase sigma-70 factor (ECF subfamily)
LNPFAGRARPDGSASASAAVEHAGLTMSGADAAAIFDPLRPALIRIAYRMLGSVADAEDMVQEAFLRWLDADRDAVREPAAYLRRVVTCLCLDHLKSARHRRETYIGPWLPEPVVEAAQDEIDDVTLPLMMALERLSPLERAAFLLHDVFGVSFEEIAETIGREPAACRQLASRARTHVRAARPRFEMPRERGLEIAAAFFTASRNGDMEALRSLLAADVTIYADGGGKRSTVRQPIMGANQVMEFHTALARLFARQMSRLVRYGIINGLPGFITIEQGETLQTTALEMADGRITAIYVTRNPEKLRHLDQAIH